MFYSSQPQINNQVSPINELVEDDIAEEFGTRREKVRNKTTKTAQVAPILSKDESSRQRSFSILQDGQKSKETDDEQTDERIVIERQESESVKSSVLSTNPARQRIDEALEILNGIDSVKDWEKFKKEFITDLVKITNMETPPKAVIPVA